MTWTNGMKGSFLVLILSLLAYSWVLYLLYWPVEVFRFNSRVNPIQPVYIGQMMYYNMDVTKKVPIVCMVTKQLISEKMTITLGTLMSNIDVGDHKRISRVMIDSAVPPNKYKFRWTAVYPVNFMRKEIIVSESDWFEVLKK
jgi:hypothetical protein